MAVKKEPVAPAPVVSDKKKALETAMQQIEKMYGKGSIMRFYRAIAGHWTAALRVGGRLLFEVGIGQADEVLRIMRSVGFGDLEITPDLNGIPRVVEGVLCSEL